MTTQHTPKRIRMDRELVDAMRLASPDLSLNDYSCGCKVMRESAGAHYIAWCPLHAAAGALLSVARTALHFFPDTRAGNDARASAAAAIAKATP